MPKSKRDMLKRQLAHAHNNVVNAQIHLLLVGEQFAEAHPELSEALGVAIIGLQEVRKIIEHFAVISWGKVPEDWSTWRNVKSDKE